MTIPSGNVTAVFLMFDIESPSASVKPSCGTFTSTVKPAGVSALLVSGETAIDGSNERWSQPVNPSGAPALPCERKLNSPTPLPILPCGIQESAKPEYSCGPVHEVGNVKNGTGLRSADPQYEVSSSVPAPRTVHRW